MQPMCLAYQEDGIEEDDASRKEVPINESSPKEANAQMFFNDDT